MRNIKINIQYDGTRYSGWQSQEHDENTIQGKLTAVLRRLLEEETELAGSGRTDAGVHALGQVANFKTCSCMSCEEILEKLNHYLPEDIAVISAEEMDGRFHSRLNAVNLSAVQNAVSDCRDLLGILDYTVLRIYQCLHNQLDCFGMCRHSLLDYHFLAVCLMCQLGTLDSDSLAETLCHYRLILHIDQLIFQRGASAVDY